MGIQGLHKFLRPYTEPHILGQSGRWKGKTVGVDAMCWMHRGAICSWARKPTALSSSS